MKKNSYKVMYEIKKGDSNYPTSIKNLMIEINKHIRKEKLQKIISNYE